MRGPASFFFSPLSILKEAKSVPTRFPRSAFEKPPFVPAKSAAAVLLFFVSWCVATGLATHRLDPRDTFFFLWEFSISKALQWPAIFGGVPSR